MTDQQLLSLTALLYVTHMNHDSMEEDWSLVLYTFDRAMNMAILRSDEDNDWTRSISSCFCRLAQFSSCFSSESLLHYLKALCSLYVFDDDSINTDTSSESKSNLVEVYSKREVGRVSFFHRGGVTNESSIKTTLKLERKFQMSFHSSQFILHTSNIPRQKS